MMIMTAHDTHVQTYRDWIAQLMAQHDIATVSELARSAGLAESTLTRLMNPEGPGNIPREGTIAKIEQRFNTRRPATRTGRNDGTEQSCADPLGTALAITEKIRAIVANDAPDETDEAYLVGDRALDLAGYLPNDIILVDPSIRPETGDIVALRFRTGPMKSRTLTLRIHDAPFLTAHSTDETLRRPILIDPDRIEIVGVVTKAMRQRRKA